MSNLKKALQAATPEELRELGAAMVPVLQFLNPIENLMNLNTGDDVLLEDCADSIERILAENGPLSSRQLAILIMRMRGMFPEDAAKMAAEDFRRRQSNAGRNSKRSVSATGGRALVGVVRTASKKTKWNTAWRWLCQQAEVKRCVENFSLDGVNDEGAVRYWHKAQEKTKYIAKSTFKDYWRAPSPRKKKAVK